MNIWNKVNDVLFRRDLYVQSLQSMIKIQQGQIDELKRDKEHYRLQYEAALSRPVNADYLAPVDPTPMNEENAEHWKPLRELPELPSQKRARLHRESVERKKKLDAERAEKEREA